MIRNTIPNIYIAALPILLFLTPTPATAANDNPVSGTTSPAALDRKISTLMDKGCIAGLSLAVIRRGQIVRSKGFGFKNYRDKTATAPDTIYEAASMGKPVFAYAVLQLVEQGILHLDRPLVNYVGLDFIAERFSRDIVQDKRLQSVTARMVLSHSAGFPNWRAGKLAFLFDPGTGFQYSGEGFVLLQLVVEQITGLPLESMMRTKVFEPLGMRDSSYLWQRRYEQRAAHPHALYTPRSLRKNSTAEAAASLWTTAEDFAKFMIAVIKSSRQTGDTHYPMLIPQSQPPKENRIAWGLGIGLQDIGQRTHQANLFWHWGDNGTYRAFAIASAKDGSGLVYFTNSTQGLSITEDLVSLVLGQKPLAFPKFLEYPNHRSTEGTLLWQYINRGINALLQTVSQSPRTQYGREVLERIAQSLQQAQKPAAALQLLQLNYSRHPQVYSATIKLARAHLEKGNYRKAERYYKKGLGLNKQNHPSHTIRWALDWLQAVESPRNIPIKKLNRLTGDYQDRHIRRKGDALYYCRGECKNSGYKKLYPLTNQIFVLKEEISFRLRFETEGNQPATAVTGVYEWMSEDVSLRTK